MSYTNRKKEVVHTLDNTATTIPKAVDIECAVLGAIMIDKDAYAEVEDNITENTFSDPRNKLVFRAIQSLALKDLPIDILTVIEELSRLNLLEEAGGPGYVTELSSRVASSANIEYHSKIIAQKETARDLILIASIMSEKAQDNTEDIDDVKEEAERKLYDLGQKGIVTEIIPLIMSLKASLKQIQDAHSNQNGLTGVPSAFPTLDEITAGFQASDLIILAGRPAMGKTGLAVNMAFNIASLNIPVAFFSLEMSHVQLTNRIISSVCEIEGSKLLRGNLTPPEWAKIDKSINAMDKELYIDDTPGLSLQQLRSKARFLVRQKGVKIIFIDYLQLLTTTVRYNSRQEEVGGISSGLKALAKELNVPIIALAQLNRGVDAREGLEGKRPQLSDLRESGSIEQDADLVMFIHRPEYYHIYQDDKGHDLHGMAQLIIAKHRKGATGDINLVFRAEFMKFEDKADLQLSDVPFPSPDEGHSFISY